MKKYNILRKRWNPKTWGFEYDGYSLNRGWNGDYENMSSVTMEKVGQVINNHGDQGGIIEIHESFEK